MTLDPKPLTQETLDQYLDGQLTAAESESVKRIIERDPKLLRQVALQARIDSCLQTSFGRTELSASRVDSIREAAEAQAKSCGSDLQARRAKIRLLVALTVAACLVWISAFAFLRMPAHRRAPPTLAEIYQDSVAHGFSPYWLCEDDRQFAQTFDRRQGQALLLAKLPQGSFMVGLHYLGGLGPKTTTLMCMVDEKEVMVFVDRVEFESDADLEPPRSASGVQYFRRRVRNLVMYEVTPYDSPRVLNFLQPVDDNHFSGVGSP